MTPMDLTPEEKARRAEWSRTNGRRSRGPTSEAGRRRSSMNALGDGLTARTFALPGEAEAAATRSETWHNWYDPQSPASVHLTSECARATSVADRCEGFRKARLKQQRQSVKRNWQRRRQRRVEALQKKVAEEGLSCV